jgi:hypothetical protein
MEVAEPYLNPCEHPSLGDRQRWSSEVLWVFRFTPSYDIAEIGWRKMCDGSPQRRFYFACCDGLVSEQSWFEIPGTNPKQYYEPIVGATYEVSLAFEPATVMTGTWKGHISGPDLPVDGKEKVQEGEDFGRYLQVGGENLFLQNDMGVAGHLDTRYVLSDSSVQHTMWGQSGVERFQTLNRYFIGAGKNPGASGKTFYQNYSDIHSLYTPTPVATTDHCAPGW